MKDLRNLGSVLLFVLLCSSLRLWGQPSAPSPTAIEEHGTLSLQIPYRSLHQGAGKLRVEVLDPENRVLGRVERNAEIAGDHGVWQQRLATETPVSIEDLVWDRIHYSFVFDGDTNAAIDGTESISQILLRPVIHILGQKSYLAGSDAAIRIIVTDSENQEIHGKGTASVELVAPDHAPERLFAGSLNRHGTVEAPFHFPEGPAGSYQLHFVVDTPLGSAESTLPVELEDKASILLTTEKPIYQPGQTIHVRALALNRANHHAESDRALAFELEDSRGNKVFRKSTQTDKFGVASAEFALADEVNLGTYHVRALMGDAKGDQSNQAEIALNVERYVLPKFKVAVEFTQKDGKSRKDYRPGDHVTGIVRANYFFGKAVDGAEIEMKVSAMDVSMFEASSASGKTDSDGNYHFDLKLPDYFAGRPISAGAARVLVEATVRDSAGHAETRGEPITVSQSPLLITAIPESGILIPDIENEVFILTSYPDGTPAKTALKVHWGDIPEQLAATDDSGIAVIHLPVDTSDGSLSVHAGFAKQTLHIDADDNHGNRTSSDVDLQSRGGVDQILLRTEHAVFRTGDPIHLKVFSTRKRGSAYVDVVKDGQTVLTRDLEIENGEAELTLAATPAMAGTLDIDAYLIGRDAQPVGDHRLVFVEPADELKIETAADAAVYKPGAEAHVHFRVTNARGEGVSAALGLQIVDEAVFALAEKQPGFAKVFFYLEQEAMKSRFEIHSLSMGDVLEPVDQSKAEQRDRAARAVFSATEVTNPNKVDTEFGRDIPQARRFDYAARYHAALLDQVRQLTDRLSHFYDQGQENLDLIAEFAKLTDEDGRKPHDAWGTELRLEATGWNRGHGRYYMVHSAGPDKQFNTDDDLYVNIEARSGKLANPPRQGSMVDLKIEHDRGPSVGRVEIVGSVTDVTGAVVPGANVELREDSNGRILRTVVNGAGQFTFAGVQAGKYNIQISSMGFEIASMDFAARSRDWAMLTVRLMVGSETQTVAVSADAIAVGVINGVAGRMATGAELQRVPIEANFAMRFAEAPMADKKDRGAGGAASPHIRSYFPEALYINPEIITNAKGDADITIPMADSITTWRMAMLASTPTGALGTGASNLKVFQDFFVDLDLPVTLTQGDQVSVPVAIYNYAGSAGKVTLNLQPEDWYSLVDDQAEKTVAAESDRVGAAQFTIEARHIGKFKLTVSAKMEGRTGREDVVVREIEVIPNGREQNIVFNGRLDNAVQHRLQFPANSIPDASAVFVRLYPGPLSQIIEGMDSILRMPGGCFEQTSSSTYPNVLALDYMKRTKKLTPEVHAKAEGYIANGYQRLLTFEVPGGGFSWFGQAPANKILTAYGLMEFNDMSKVYEVDPRIIERTGDWLAHQQQHDGSWKPDTSFINEGATNRYNSDVLRITAYIAWALANTDYHGDATDKAKDFIETNLSAKADPYTLAIIANFAVDYGKDREFTQRAIQLLLDARIQKNEEAWWTADETGVYSTGSSAAIETTGLAAQALLKWGQSSETARKALAFIAAKKDASGAWGSTQATIIALRALLLAAEKSAADVRGTVEVVLNGKESQKLTLTADNSDLLHQFVFKGIDANESNSVEIRFDGKGGLGYQVVGRYFVPWESKEPNEALSIDVKYDRTKLARNDIATATATVRNNLDKTANMVMIDLGIPPGFDLLSEDLQDFQEKSSSEATGRLEKFSQTATQAILYFNSLGPNQTLKLKFRLRAKYPIRAKSLESRTYEYYDPEVSATAAPIELEVVEHANR
jgi:A-macroglobulin TED domain/Alpha-2-macroglobulin family/MG2 domain/A-macroglobulin receptor binding domain/Carboxypeptidase regulatory-like domain/Alpha-2-macroglobulin bait region domain/Macroglobulin domain MG3